MKNSLFRALAAGAILATPFAATATMPTGSNMDDMTASPGAPVDYGSGPGQGKRAARERTPGHAGARPAYVAGTVSQGGPNAGVAGFFDPPVNWPIIGLHELLLPDGRVLNYGTSETGAQGAKLIYDVWDPTLGTGTNAHTLLPNTTSTDIFCSAQSMIWSTGQVLITGGDLTINGKRNFSNNMTTIFDPPSDTLSTAGQMAYPRWYPTIVATPDGDMAVLGGRLAPNSPATTPEVYNPVTGWRTLTTAASTAAFGQTVQAWFYPKAWVSPAGGIFIVAPGGEMLSLDISGTGTITRLPKDVAPGAWDLPTVMYAPGMLLSLRNNAAVSTINLNGKFPVVTPTAPIDQVRFWSTATVLADGEVLVTGGSTVANELTNVDYTAELWNPTTGQWTAGAAATKPRLYHSIALLLPDATVLTGAGGAPGPINELNSEIYYPPYLYLNDGSGNPAPRPTLVSAPTTATVGQAVTATVGPSDAISRVTFVRTGSMTHSTNVDQRFINVPFTQSGATVTATLPSNPNVMLPGYYMMFVHQNGVPSVSQIILVTVAGTDISGAAIPARRTAR
jgi:hypothetical protein